MTTNGWTIEEILARAEPQEDIVTLYLAGKLVAEYERLSDEMETASTEADSLGDQSPYSVLRERRDALVEQMAASRVEFRLKALSREAWSDMFAIKPEVPARPGEDATPEEIEAYTAVKAEADKATRAWLAALVAATVYQPAMTAAQAVELSRALSNRQWLQLENAAWALNTDEEKIPFIVAGSASRQPTGEK